MIVVRLHSTGCILAGRSRIHAAEVRTQVMSWMPAEKVAIALGGRWPKTLLELALWAVEESPSIYTLLQVREVVECTRRTYHAEG